MAWRRQGDKPLSEPMLVRLPTHICVTRPQWVELVRIGISNGFKFIYISFDIYCGLIHCIYIYIYIYMLLHVLVCVCLMYSRTIAVFELMFPLTKPILNKVYFTSLLRPFRRWIWIHLWNTDSTGIKLLNWYLTPQAGLGKLLFWNHDLKVCFLIS